MPGAFGSHGFGTSPYGSSLVPFGVASAVSLSPTWVRVSFTDLLDPSFAPFLAAPNYSITPSLPVHAAIIDSAQSVRLLTDSQTPVTYTVTVTLGRSVYGFPLDFRLRTATFEGLNPAAKFFAVPIRNNRVRLVFDQRMSPDPETSNPANYEILNAQTGLTIPISSVTEEFSGVQLVAVVLELAAALQITGVYRAKVGSFVHTFYGANVYPDTSRFQWVQYVGRLSVPIGAFSGELHGGPLGSKLGRHQGLIYFSPALETNASNSIIEVDECSVCTKAYDEYHIPVPVDPKVLYTFGSGTSTVLGAGAVLWAPRPRICEARMDLGDLRAETVPPPVDSHCIATFREPWDQNFVALLNNTHWKVFDNAGTPPAYFITAANLAPIPPGPTVTRVLQPPP